MLLEANRLALELTEGEAATIASAPTRRVNFGVYIYIEDEPRAAAPPA
jgi:hypothetical protein